MHSTAQAVVIGAAILDLPVGPVDARVFASGSHPVERIPLGFGGDALNEATVLARLGTPTRLLSKVGEDPAGQLVRAHCAELGLDISQLIVEPGLDTGVNLVLIAPDGERSFVTARTGSLRALRPEDIAPAALDGVRLLSFASIFVSPHFSPAALEQLFGAARARGVTTCADLTVPKHGELAADLGGALSALDYLFANRREAAAFTGQSTVDGMLDELRARGCGHAVIKEGADGCTIAGPGLRARVPAYAHADCVDTTGAGDSFVAGFLHALLQGMPPVECARFANATASLAIEAVGATAGVTGLDAVMRRLHRMPAR